MRFHQHHPKDRDETVLELVRIHAPVTASLIVATVAADCGDAEPCAKAVDGSLQRLRRAGKIRVYPKRGLWSVVP